MHPDRPAYLHDPLTDHIGGDTRVRIVCERCTHEKIMRTSDLHAAAPGAITVGEFARRMKCTKCKCRGWVSFRAAGR